VCDKGSFRTETTSVHSVSYLISSSSLPVQLLRCLICLLHSSSPLLLLLSSPLQPHSFKGWNFMASKCLIKFHILFRLTIRRDQRNFFLIGFIRLKKISIRVRLKISFISKDFFALIAQLQLFGQLFALMLPFIIDSFIESQFIFWAVAICFLLFICLFLCYNIRISWSVMRSILQSSVNASLGHACYLKGYIFSQKCFTITKEVKLDKDASLSPTWACSWGGTTLLLQ